uniref:Uncharacterized protein n=1 Tax=Arundo donax TaxID=35708 RepID=A0A0A9H478_ARUDO
MARTSLVISVEGLRRATKKLSMMGEHPTKKSLPLRCRKWVPNGCPCGYLANPRKNVRGVDLGADSPKCLATTDFEPSHPIRTQ